MALGSVFLDNRTQPVRLPTETLFPEVVKKVLVRVVGVDRVLPRPQCMGQLFLSKERATDDFMTERASQAQTEREAL